MSNISFNPIGWQSDTLQTRKTALLVTADTYPADLRRAETVIGITVTGLQGRRAMGQAEQLREL